MRRTLSRMRAQVRHAARPVSPPGPMDPRRWVIRVVAAFLGTLLLMGVTVYVIDPFQAYRKPTLYRPVFVDPYYTIPGIIRHYEFDSVVVGSSMCQNFRISELQEKLGWRCVKLTPPGCKPATVRLLITQACSTKRVAHVLLGIDLLGFGTDAQEHRVAIPEYLYDANPWNDYRYLWNRTVLAESIPAVLKANLSHRPRQRQRLDEDRMWSWDFEDGRRRYGWQAVLAAEQSRGALHVGGLDASALAAMRTSLTRNILEPIRQNRGSDFVVFLPPYSVLAWSLLQQQGALDALLTLRQTLMHDLLAEPNVRLFDFQAEAQIVCDFDLYKDSTHYAPLVGRIILDRIRAQPDGVAEGDIATSTQRLRELVAKFRSGPQAQAVGGAPGADGIEQ